MRVQSLYCTFPEAVVKLSKPRLVNKTVCAKTKTKTETVTLKTKTKTKTFTTKTKTKTKT